MCANRTRVLLILPQDLLDRARVLAGKATAAFKLPVSLQIVLRALIGEGLKRDDDPALLANVEGQAKAVRHIRSVARQRGRAEEKGGNRRLESGDSGRAAEAPDVRGLRSDPARRRAGANGAGLDERTNLKQVVVNALQAHLRTPKKAPR
jgi:hypothetical protein